MVEKWVMRQLLDPRLSRELTDDFPDLCTIKLKNLATSPSGQPLPAGEPIPIDGMIDIPCRIGPLILVRPTDKEIRGIKITSQYENRQCKLNGYFPAIDPFSMVATVNDREYDIMGLEHDGNRFSSRMTLQRLLP